MYHNTSKYFTHENKCSGLRNKQLGNVLVQIILILKGSGTSAWKDQDHFMINNIN